MSIIWAGIALLCRHRGEDLPPNAFHALFWTVSADVGLLRLIMSQPWA